MQSCLTSNPAVQSRAIERPTRPFYSTALYGRIAYYMSRITFFLAQINRANGGIVT